MKRILVMAALGVALAGTQGSIASDAPSSAACSIAPITLEGAACDPSACPLCCPPSCVEACQAGDATDASAVAKR